MRLLFLFALSLSIVTLSACVYRMDIDQGNRIDQETLAKLEPGMTRKQVEFLLGKAAINDSFHAREAHYIYYLYKGKEQQSEQKTMTLTYDEQDILQTIEGGL